MNPLSPLRFLLAAALFTALPLQAADIKTESQPLLESIQKAIQAGKRTEADLAPELKQLEACSRLMQARKPTTWVKCCS
ncbi:MAG: hypothetical protein WDN28_22035 [Chthoniobacter sp.]